MSYSSVQCSELHCTVMHCTALHYAVAEERKLSAKVFFYTSSMDNLMAFLLHGSKEDRSKTEWDLI